MKITVSQLRRIIAEELRRALRRPGRVEADAVEIFNAASPLPYVAPYRGTSGRTVTSMYGSGD